MKNFKTAEQQREWRAPEYRLLTHKHRLPRWQRGLAMLPKSLFINVNKICFCVFFCLCMIKYDEERKSFKEPKQNKTQEPQIHSNPGRLGG